jgi:hypothetical protein
MYPYLRGFWYVADGSHGWGYREGCGERTERAAAHGACGMLSQPQLDARLVEVVMAARQADNHLALFVLAQTHTTRRVRVTAYTTPMSISEVFVNHNWHMRYCRALCTWCVRLRTG